MIIVAQVSFPRESVNQAVKVYVGLEGLPGDVEKTGPFFKAGSNRIRAITLYHLDRTDDNECLDLIDERYRAFDGVPGFTKNIERWYSFDSAIDRFLR